LGNVRASRSRAGSGLAGLQPLETTGQLCQTVRMPGKSQEVRAVHDEPNALVNGTYYWDKDRPFVRVFAEGEECDYGR
jgi:hypothetical protein